MEVSTLWQHIDKVATITNVGELVHSLKQKQLRIDKSQDQLFYRGESKNYLNTKLMPKVFREGYSNKEYDYYYDILTNFPQEFENLSNLSRLSKMQHYWCPTRLLDLTSNPLVALYFACCENPNQTGYFYIFKTKEVLNYDSDRALLLSCISHLNSNQQKSVYEFICDFIIDKDMYEKYKGRLTNEYISGKTKNQNDDEDGCFQFERLIGEVIRERSAFVNYKTVAKDLLKRYIVRPLIQNERQKKQDGLFLIFGLLGNRDIQVKNDIEVYYFEVKNKRNILKELDLLGINHSTIYCDIASRAEYLEKTKLKV